MAHDVTKDFRARPYMLEFGTKLGKALQSMSKVGIEILLTVYMRFMFISVIN